MPDHSELDRRYFIDNRVYNCPFCNRNHVAYRVVNHGRFNWNDSKFCQLYLCRCESCEKTSMHLSFQEIELYTQTYGNITYFASEHDLDSKFFYSVPTSFFTLDERIPRVLRDLMTEAQGCLKSNWLTGASACVRKLIYELAQDRGGIGDTYEDRIKSLKAMHPDVDATYFDTLSTVQQTTSSKVHENAYDGWKASHLRLMIATIHDVLEAIYVLLEERKRKREAILAMTRELLPAQEPPSTRVTPA